MDIFCEKTQVLTCVRDWDVLYILSVNQPELTAGKKL